MTTKVKIKLSPGATLPKKAHIGDAGLDLTATSRRMDKSGYTEYGTGVHIQLPKNRVGLIFPRSSISSIKMSLTNSVGVIDENYTGEILCRFKPATMGQGIYEVGDRIVQLIILPYPQIELVEVSELSATVRAATGFGSSNFIDEQFTLREELDK